MTYNNRPIMVSVCMITYNHEAYIAQAIESVLNQQCNFRFEFIIAEDCSKDNTRAIVGEYFERYPEIIVPVLPAVNQGAMKNFVNALTMCKGKYIAVLEGDDYWIDMQKLQKQVDFLEANPDFTMCFSSVQIKDELGWNWDYSQYYPALTSDVVTMEDFVMSTMNIIPTPTILIKNLLPKPLPAFFVNALAGDMSLQLLIADKGKAKYFAEPTAVYRNHGGGVTKSKENIEKGEAALEQVYIGAMAYFGSRHEKLFRRKLLDMARVRLLYGARHEHGINKVKHYFRRMPAYLKYSDGINFKELAYYHLVLFFPSLLKGFKK